MQCLQSAEQRKPAFLQLHVCDEHPLVHLHETIESIEAGAALRVVVIGTTPRLVKDQPQAKGIFSCLARLVPDGTP